MKYLIQLLLLGLTCCAAPSLQAQDCPEFSRMINEARNLLAAEKYIQSINKLSAAREYCPEASKAVDREIETIVSAIEAKKKQADADRSKAENARLLADTQRKEAESLRDEQSRLYRQAQAEQQRAEREKLKADSLIIKGERLAATLNNDPGGNIFNYLYQQGQQYLAFDSSSQKRDYRQAHIQFALAQFMQPAPDAALATLVQCTRWGKEADLFFNLGKLDSAELRYQVLQTGLNALKINTFYENRQLQRIRETRDQWNELLQNCPPGGCRTLTFSGHWWTIPDDIRRLPGLQSVLILDNPALSEALPGALLLLDTLVSLKIRHCANLIRLDNWGQSLALDSLEITGHEKLVRLQLPGHSPRLGYLNLSHNPALVDLQGLTNLRGLRHLVLVGNEKLALLNGAQHYPQLQRLQLSGNPALREIRGFRQAPVLTNITIADNDKLHSLRQFASLPALDTLRIIHNKYLGELPAWETLPALQYLEITGNKRLWSLGETRGLRHIDRLKMYQNQFQRYFVGIKSGGLGILNWNLTDYDSYYDINKKYRLPSAYTSEIFIGIDGDRAFGGRLSVGITHFENESPRDPADRAANWLFWSAEEEIPGQALAAPGYETIENTYLTVGLSARINLFARKWGLYLGGGPVYSALMSGKYEITLFDARYQGTIQPQSALYLNAFGGLSWRLRNLRIFLELGVQFSLKGIFSSEYKSVFAKRLYVDAGGQLGEAPTPDHYHINYVQDVFDGFIHGSIGVALPLKFY